MRYIIRTFLLLCVTGDRVALLAPGGGNAEYVVVNEGHVMPIPSHVTMEEAGGLPEVWLTAYQLLHFVGKYFL